VNIIINLTYICIEKFLSIQLNNMIFLKAQRLSFVDGAHYSRSCIDLQWLMFSMRILFYISCMSDVQKQVITSILMNVKSIKMQFLAYFYTLLWANKFWLNMIQRWIFFSIRGCLSESWTAHLLIWEIQSSWCIFPSQICCSEGLEYLRVYLTMSLFHHAWFLFFQICDVAMLGIIHKRN